MSTALVEGTMISTSSGLAERSMIPPVGTHSHVRGEDGVLSSQGMSKHTADPLPRVPMS